MGRALVNPTTVPDTNPFVGPRSFEPTDRLHGRDREIQELVDVLVAERVVLLHSPSGAGKTSLLRAGVLPRLQEDGFAVLPVVRLTHELPPELVAPDAPIANRYVVNTLLSLEEGRPAPQQRPAAELAGLSIGQYLAAARGAARGGTEVLVFDQFEEVITADPTDVAAKTEFFTQLGAALRDRGRWALFALREDFLAELDPYAALVPTRLANRFRLDLLSVDAALAAVTRTAAEAGVVFEPAAAARLVDDLRRVRLQRPGGPVHALGPHVEPVQLQVVCRRLWERLPAGARTIDLSDVRDVGDVEQSLAGYYAECVAAAARWAEIPERALRDWCERALVTAQGFRGQAVDGPTGTEAQDRSVLGQLTSVHLLRAESRRGATWYELAHDRLVTPVLTDNARWRAANLSDFEQRAAWWDEQGRPDQLLLTGDQLAAVPAADERELPEREREYLTASRRAREQAERERRANRRTRRWLVVALVGLGLAVLSFAVAVRYWLDADEQGDIATRALLVQQGTQWLPSNGDLGLLLGLRATTLDGSPDVSDPQVQAFLQNAVDTLPVVQVLRAGGPATAVGYSADGRFVLTGHADGSVLVRDSATGDTVRTLTAAGPVRALDIGPGTGPDQVVAVAGVGGAVQVWLPGRGEAVSPPGQRGDVLGVRLRPDGTAVAAGGADGAVVVADVATGAVLRELRRPGPAATSPPAINDVAWTPDGARVIAADDEGVIAVWDADSGALLREIRAHSGPATALRTSGSRLVSGGADGVTAVWDGGTGAEVFRVSGRWPVADVSAAPDGSRLLAVDIAGTASVVDGIDGQVLRTVSGHGARPLAAQLDPAAPDRAAVATRDGAAAIWNVAVGHPRYPRALATAAAGATVTAAPDDPTVRIWSPDGRERGAVPVGPAGVADVALSADGRRLAVLDAAGVASIRPVPGPGPVLTLPAAGVTALAISPDGRLVAAGSGAGVAVWSADTGAPVRTLDPATAAVGGLAFHPAGDRLVGIAADGTAVVWGLDDGHVRHTLALDGTPTTVAWSPAGDTVATSGGGLTVQLWDPGTGQPRRSLPGHREPVNDLAFDATGARLASVGEDGEVQVWNTATGDVELRRQFPDWVYRVAFTPDGRHLVVTDRQPLPHVVYLDGPELLQVAQARPTRALTGIECARFVQPYTDCAAGG
ncbi:MAG TPA: hypothetical protein VNO83_15150 [Pseudonocardia sp.]|nr:hypothetical protein [Pseudonocardia sp.]